MDDPQPATKLRHRSKSRQRQRVIYDTDDDPDAGTVAQPSTETVGQRGRTSGPRSFAAGSFGGLHTKAEILENTVLAKEKIDEISELYEQTSPDQMHRDVNWAAKTTEMQEYAEARKRLQASDEKLVNSMKEGYKCMGNWDKLRGIAKLDSASLLALRDKLPANILPSLVRLLIICYDGPESIRDLPPQFRDIFAKDVRHVSLLDSNQPPPSQNAFALQSQLGSTTEDAKRLENEIKTHKNTIEQLNTKCNTQAKKMKHLQSTIDGHTKAMQDKQFVMDEMKIKIADHKTVIAVYDKKVARLEDIGSDQLGQLEDLRSRIHKLEEEKTASEQELEATKADIQRIRGQAKLVSSNNMKTYSTATNSLKATIRELREQAARETERHEKRVARIKRKAKEAEGEMNDCLEKCQHDLDQAQHLVRSKQGEIDDWKNEYKLQDERIVALCEQNDEYERECFEAGKTSGQQRLEISKRDDELRVNAGQLASKDEEIQRLNSRITVLKGHVSQATVDKDEMTNLRDELGQKKTALTDLQSELASTKDQLSESQTAHEKLRREFDTLEQNTKAKDTDLAVTQSQLNVAKQKLSAKEKEYDQVVSNCEKEIRDAERQTEKVRDSWKTSRTHNQELRNEKTALQDDLEKQINSNKTQMEDVVRLGREVDTLNTSLEQSKNMCEALRTESEELMAEKQQLEETSSATLEYEKGIHKSALEQAQDEMRKVVDLHNTELDQLSDTMGKLFLRKTQQNRMRRQYVIRASPRSSGVEHDRRVQMVYSTLQAKLIQTREATRTVEANFARLDEERSRLLTFLADLCGVTTTISPSFQHLIEGVYQSQEHGEVETTEELAVWRILDTWSDEAQQRDLVPPFMECEVLPLFGMVEGHDISLWQCQKALHGLIESTRSRPQPHTRKLLPVVDVVLPWAAKHDMFEIALALWQLICLVQKRWNTMASGMDVHRATVEEYLRGHVYSQVFAMIDGSCGVQDLQGDGFRLFSDTVIFSDSAQDRMVIVNTQEQTVRCFARGLWQWDILGGCFRVRAGHGEVVIHCKTDADMDWALMQL